MRSPQNFKICPLPPLPLLSRCLKCESPSNRTSLIATTPAPNGKDFLLRHSLKGNILSASYDIQVYSTRSSGNKI